MLKLRIEKLGQNALLHVVGHIVIGPETEALRTSVLSQSGVSGVVLDLTRITRIDAHGLGVLLQLREQLESCGIEFRLINVSNLVQQILRMTCLDSVFEIAREEEIRAGLLQKSGITVGPGQYRKALPSGQQDFS